VVEIGFVQGESRQLNGDECSDPVSLGRRAMTWLGSHGFGRLDIIRTAW